jgi:glycine cleavage system aminomethyltransferase T
VSIDGRTIGEITSAGYSRTFGGSIAMVYVRAANLTGADNVSAGGGLDIGNDAALDAARWQVDIAGTLYAARPHLAR